MSHVAIIPARGGSKRLPRKNIIDFLGRPIIAYTIEAALQSKLFERVVVSTEDSEIAEVAKRYGADIAIRRSELASDKASLREVCLDFLSNEAVMGRSYEIFSCLLATAPLRSSQDIYEVGKLIKQGECDFAMAVTNYDLPPHQALRKSQGNVLQPMWPDIVNVRSQDIPELFVDNGSTYFAKVAAFEQEKTFYGSNLRGYSMPRERSVDIDDETDFELALFWARKLGL